NQRLLKILRHYVIKTGLTNTCEADSAAAEVLNATVIEALQHPDRFHAVDAPIAWVLGVALNVIRRKLAKRNQLNHREPLLRDLYPQDSLTDDELIDQFLPLTQPNAAPDVSPLFTHLSDDEARLLRLAVLHDLSSDLIAQELGITPGAARVRLHRLLKRLRHSFKKEEL